MLSYIAPRLVTDVAGSPISKQVAFNIVNTKCTKYSDKRKEATTIICYAVYKCGGREAPSWASAKSHRSIGIL